MSQILHMIIMMLVLPVAASFPFITSVNEGL